MSYGALGGGTFLVQNKILPGTYINYISVDRASNIFTDRGYATIGLPMDWGAIGEMIVLEASDLQKESIELLGHSYTDDELRPLREIFKGAKTLYLYRLNDEGGKKATAILDGLTIEAKHVGIAGNEIMVSIEKEIDTESYTVTTRMKGKVVDIQTVVSGKELQDNAVVSFKTDVEILSLTAGIKLENGENGKVTGNSHTNYLELAETYDFNVIGCASEDETVKSLYKEFTRRMRDDEGVKFQCVVYNMDHIKADFEGLINVKNETLNAGNPASLVYWVTGREAGTNINQSLTNVLYDGEYEINANMKTRDFKEFLTKGYFTLYKRNEETRVLEDINSFISFSKDKNNDFSKNQVIRVLDQRAIDTSIIFNKLYLGKTPNDEEGRISLWNELVKHAGTMMDLRAIKDYEGKDTEVSEGNGKDSVLIHDYLNPTMAMQKLYMVIHVA